MCIRDRYKCTEFRIPGAGKAELVFTGADGSEQRATVFDFEGAGVLQGQYNKMCIRDRNHTAGILNRHNLPEL